MAWKWAAPASAVVSAVIAGGVRTLTRRSFATKNIEGSPSAIDLEQAREHTVEAYVRLTEMIDAMGSWMDRVVEEEVDGVTVENSAAEIVSVQSLVTTHGSREVGARFDEFLAHIKRISRLAARRRDLDGHLVGDADATGQNSDLDPTLGALVGELALARRTRSVLVDLVAEELRAPPRADRTPADHGEAEPPVRTREPASQVYGDSRVLEPDRPERG